MNRGLTIVGFTLHGGRNFTIADMVDDDGKFMPLGVDTLKAFKAKRQLVIHTAQPGHEATLIVPYHAVMEYAVMKDVADVTKPSDAFCVDRGSKGADSLVGSAIVGESTVGGE